MATNSEPRWCPNCGKPLFPAASFCPSCGVQVLPDGSFIVPGSPGFGGQPSAPQATPMRSTAGPVPQAAILPASPSPRRIWIVLGIVIFVAVVAAAGVIALVGSGAIAPHHDIAGAFQLNNSASASDVIQRSGTACSGTGGYSDIQPGAQVTLKDGAGAILATSQLGAGSTGTNLSCTFTFTIANVPEVPFYSVEISHRGQVTNSLADMKANGWTFSLSLGK